MNVKLQSRIRCEFFLFVVKRWFRFIDNRFETFDCKKGFLPFSATVLRRLVDAFKGI